MSKFLPGHKVPPEVGRKISLALTGKKQSEITKYRMHLAMSGKKNPFYGHQHSEETKQKIAESHRLPIPITKEELYHLYWIENLSGQQISTKVNLPKYKTVYSWLKYYDIPRKQKPEAIRGKNKVFHGDIETRRQNLRKAHTKFHLTKEELENHYVKEKMSGRQISKLYGMSPGTAYAKMRKFSIPIVNPSGERNSNWKGGIRKSHGHYPAGFNNPLKEQIRQRDRRTCQLCGTSEESLVRRLGVHHINYNKEDLDLHNLVSLCGKCNSRVNAERAWWRFYWETLNPQWLRENVVCVDGMIRLEALC